MWEHKKDRRNPKVSILYDCSCGGESIFMINKMMECVRRKRERDRGERGGKGMRREGKSIMNVSLPFSSSPSLSSFLSPLLSLSLSLSLSFSHVRGCQRVFH